MECGHGTGKGEREHRSCSVGKGQREHRWCFPEDLINARKTRARARHTQRRMHRPVAGAGEEAGLVHGCKRQARDRRLMSCPCSRRGYNLLQLSSNHLLTPGSLGLSPPPPFSSPQSRVSYIPCSARRRPQSHEQWEIRFHKDTGTNPRLR